jgi:hypothetical protein
MAFWLAFGERCSRFPIHPSDPGDFDRCLRLLNWAPGLRAELPRLSDLSDKWAALAARWDEVEALHLSEAGLGHRKSGSAPKTYVLMQSILQPATTDETA